MAKVWKDYPDTTTPLTAAELNRLENAILDVQTSIAASVADLANLKTQFKRQLTGIATIPKGSSTWSQVRINFPAGVFTTPPTVQLTHELTTAVTGYDIYIDQPGVTTSGFTIGAAAPGSTFPDPVKVHWLATAN